MKKKTTKKEAPKKTLTIILAEAGKGYAKTIKGLVQFACAYVQAIELYSQEGKRAFADKFALYTKSDWDTFEDIGRGRLLPQFAFASGNMKKGLLRLEKSIDKQLTLLGCVKGGKLETIDAKGKVVLKSFEELGKLEEDSILFALSEATKPGDIRKFARQYRVDFALAKSNKPNAEIIGDLLVVNRKCKFSKQELQAWVARMG